MQRWRKQGVGEDRRAGPKTSPANKLTPPERGHILEVVNRAEYRDLSPKQIVPRLADQGIWIGSESTIYRLLREVEQQRHRENTRPPQPRHRPREHQARGPLQVWCWDITYLPSSIRGRFFYLYMILDVFSRKIVGWAVHEAENAEHARQLLLETCLREGIDGEGLVFHSDNGGPMKAATMLATLQALGVIPSFSRPSVSNDNPYSESAFRTLKYRPWYPTRPFDSLEAARAWVEGFVHWYNEQHRHSAISYVTPHQRHEGLDVGPVHDIDPRLERDQAEHLRDVRILEVHADQPVTGAPRGGRLGPSPAERAWPLVRLGRPLRPRGLRAHQQHQEPHPVRRPQHVSLHTLPPPGSTITAPIQNPAPA